MIKEDALKASCLFGFVVVELPPAVSFRSLTVAHQPVERTKKIGRQADPKKKELLGKTERCAFSAVFLTLADGFLPTSRTISLSAQTVDDIIIFRPPAGGQIMVPIVFLRCFSLY